MSTEGSGVSSPPTPSIHAVPSPVHPVSSTVHPTPSSVHVPPDPSVTPTPQDQKNSKKKKPKKKKKKTTTETTTVPVPSPSAPARPPVNAKLQDQLKTLRARRTGQEHRQQVKAYKASQSSQGKKPKNAMKHMAREGIRELLKKLNVQDPQVEAEIMNEIIRGGLRTPGEIATYIVQKLQRLYPQGPPPRSSPPAEGGTVPPVNPSGNLSSNPSSDPSAVATSRKPLRHPTADLLLNPAQ